MSQKRHSGLISIDTKAGIFHAEPAISIAPAHCKTGYQVLMHLCYEERTCILVLNRSLSLFDLRTAGSQLLFKKSHGLEWY